MPGRKRYKADLHNHSCLSPCGSLEMSPGALARRAAAAGIEMLALTDHNSARNLEAFAVCCNREGITPIFGLEVNTREEVHVVCLFRDRETAESFGMYIESLLPAGTNDPELIGDQAVVDADEQVILLCGKLLMGAADIPFDLLTEMVPSLGGLAVPAHIDRPFNGAISQLGFLPELHYGAVEVLEYPSSIETWGNTLITGSDAHFPSAVGTRSFWITDCRGPAAFDTLADALLENRVEIASGLRYPKLF